MAGGGVSSEVTARLREWARAGAGAERLAAGLGLVQAGLSVGFAWFAAGAVAALVAGEPAWTAAGLALAFAVARALAQAGEGAAGFEAGAAVRAHVRREAAAGLARHGPALSERETSGALASGLVDSVEKLDGYYARLRPLAPLILLGPAGFAVAAMLADVGAGAILLAALILAPIGLALAGAGAAAASKSQMSVLRRLAGRFNDRLQALETINAFNAANREADTLAQAAEDFRTRTMRVLSAAFLSSAALELVSAGAIAMLALYASLALTGAAPFGLGETLTLRDAAFVVLLAPDAFAPLRRLSASYHDRADAEAGAEALAPLFAGAGTTPSQAPALTRAPEIRFEAAGSVYSDGRRGLAPVTLAAPAGRTTIVWGASGVGKSTLLKLLMGYAPLTEGRVLVDGEPLGAGLAGHAGWIGQRARIFHGSLRDNITLFDDTLSHAAVRAAAERAGVSDFADALPDGLDTLLGERGFGLSGGQAQRVALARALVRDVAVLLLDEPTAHLDGEAAARFIDALNTAAQGRTLLIATHDRAVRAIGERVISLETLKEDAA